MAMESEKNGISTFNVREFGAAGDGKTLDTNALQAAIDACAAAGGGVVHCPPGLYRIGTTEIKSNVNLHLEAGAVLLGSTRREDYYAAAPPSQPDPEKALFHLIVARAAENVAITGRGVIDGQGDSFFLPRQPGDTHLGARDWRPWRMVSFLECRNVLLEDVTLRNSPAYTVWPCGCDDVRIRGIRLFNNL
ncbi:MAG: glycosyl hydrolase family 28-related protein, partial [Planctomycetota bacterium]